MINNEIKKLLEAQNRLRRQLEPHFALKKVLGDISGTDTLSRLLKHTDIYNQASQFNSEFHKIQDTLMEAEKRFRLPEIAEAKKLFLELDANSAVKAITQHQKHFLEFQRTMESMRTPWLDIEDQLRSVGGFVELQKIGYAMRTLPAFDTHLTNALRAELGDWRDKINWPSNIFTDPLARTSFYEERGFDTALTAFPTKAFEQSIDLAGIREVMPPFAQAYNREPEYLDETEAGLLRNNEAHDRIQRFETQIRKFIDENMTAVFGEGWVKHQVPGDIQIDWLNKREKAINNYEAEWPLISYADFSDYVPIITRKDNWQKVFKPIFKRKASVQESFQRLYPIRICTMHARLITQDDMLYLYVETKRILNMIKIL